MYVCFCVSVFDVLRRFIVAKSKVGVSERALIARLNRKLAHKWLQVKKCRVDSRDYFNLGDYYVIDLRANLIESQNVDLTVLAKKYGVLAGYEELAK